MWREEALRPHRALPVSHYAGIVFVIWGWTGAIGLADAKAPQGQPGHENWTIVLVAAQWAALVLLWLVIATAERRHRRHATAASNAR